MFLSCYVKISANILLLITRCW